MIEKIIALAIFLLIFSAILIIGYLTFSKFDLLKKKPTRKTKANIQARKNVLLIISFLAHMVILLLAGYGLIWAARGTTYTNTFSLEKIFPSTMAGHISFALTLGLILPQFILKKTKTMQVTVILILVISSWMAINTIQTNEVIKSEDRLKTDETYQRLKLKYDNLVKQCLNEQQIINTQSDSSVKFHIGAREARLRLDENIIKRDQAEIALETHADSLQKKGSQYNQAAAEVWSAVFSNVDAKKTTVFGTIILSVVNDLLVVVFTYIIKSILGLMILIPALAFQKEVSRHVRIPDFTSRIIGMECYSTDTTGSETEITGSKPEIHRQLPEAKPEVIAEANRLLMRNRGDNKNRMLTNFSFALNNLVQQKSGNPEQNVSKKELCRHFAGQNLKQTQIAQLLSISERQVRYHLKGK